MRVCEQADYHEAVNMIYLVVFGQAYSDKYEGVYEHEDLEYLHVALFPQILTPSRCLFDQRL